MRQIPFARPLIGLEEKRAVSEVLDNPVLVHGPRSKQFEADFSAFTGSLFAISVSSATAALHLSYFHLGIHAGDEVIVPAQTHVATAHAVELCGATPVFVDADPSTGNIDIDSIESVITARTKAISIVHFLGLPVDMRAVQAIAARYNLFLIEDCALAVGTRFDGIHAGCFGTTGCFSFYPVKHITTAEGGMLLTQDEKIAAGILRQRAFGVDRTAAERSIPGIYEVPLLGFNYRMSEIHAAIGIEQLRKARGFLEKRAENYAALELELRKIPEVSILGRMTPEMTHSHYCLSIMLKPALVSNRAAIIKRLNAQGVGTSVYYPRPVPHFEYYRSKYGYSLTDFPQAAAISYGSIALPVGPHLTIDDMHYIANAVKDALAHHESVP